MASKTPRQILDEKIANKASYRTIDFRKNNAFRFTDWLVWHLRMTWEEIDNMSSGELDEFWELYENKSEFAK